MTALADLLTSRDARYVLAHHDIVAVFRILRDAGVSQASIARHRAATIGGVRHQALP